MTSLAPPSDSTESDGEDAQSAKRGANARFLFWCVAAGMPVASLVVSPDAQGALGGALGLLMFAVARADWRRFVVPDALVAGAFALAIVRAAITEDEAWAGALMAISSAAFAAGLFFLVRVAYRHFRGREGLGLGDVKLAAAAGAWLGLSMLPVAIEVAAASAFAAHLLRQRKRRRRLRSMARLPFGGYFALAIWLCWLLEARLADWG